MNKAVKTRLCWNCEGSVALTDETCPYCGVSVIPASLDDGMHSYTPPYSPHAFQHDDEIPHAPYEEEESQRTSQAATLNAEGSEPSLDEFKRAVLSILFLSSGTVLFFFGLALALFSTDGTLTLYWDGSIWFIYSILSLPLLCFGWRALMKLD